MAIYKTGDTIRVTAIFYTFAGVITDCATMPTIKLYSADKVTVAVTGTVSRDDVGTYHADLTLPTAEGTYYVETAGVAESKPIIEREAINVRFSGMT
jgi:hypothetical protein